MLGEVSNFKLACLNIFHVCALKQFAKLNSMRALDLAGLTIMLVYVQFYIVLHCITCITCVVGACHVYHCYVCSRTAIAYIW